MERVDGNLASTWAAPPAGGYCGLTVNTMTCGERRFAPHLLDRADPRLTVRTRAPAHRILWGAGGDAAGGAGSGRGGRGSKVAEGVTD